MAKTVPPTSTEPVDVLDVMELRSLTDHPHYRPVFAEKLALQKQQRAVEAELTTLGATSRRLQETGGSSRELRLARERLTELNEMAEDLQTQLVELGPAAEQAAINARADVRPALQAAAVDLLEQLREVLAHVVDITAQAHAVDRQALTLLGVTLLGNVIDANVPWRIKQIEQRLAYLQSL